MAGAAEGEAVIVHSPRSVDDIEHVRCIRYLHGKRVVMRRLTWLITEDFKRNSGQHNLSFPVGLESPAGLLSLVRGLVERGYDDEAVRKILGGNLLRLFRETLRG